MATSYDYLMDEWQVGAAEEGCTPNEYFVLNACEILNGHGYDLDSFEPSYFREQTQAGNVYPCVDGFCFDIKNRNKITLVICDYSESSSLLNLRQEELDKHFKHIKNFYIKARKNQYQYVSQSSAVAPVLNVITDENRGFIENNGSITFMLITNKNVPNNLRIPPDDIWKETGCSIKHIVADFNAISSVKRPPLELDFRVIANGKYAQGIPCLSVQTGENVDFYKSYLFAIPAEALVACYDQYTTRLLEHNVRVYLRRTKVNEGIKKTIRDEPQAFFIYNNGLAITADSVDFSEDGRNIICLHNPQIVNGGQTMATLHEAAKRDKRDVSSVYVQVKLTVIPKLLTDAIVPYISQYSNSQNAVSITSLRSNDIVQRAYESHSRSIRIPGQRPVYWYYERLKGQYKTAQLFMTPAQKKAFAATYPKKMMVDANQIAQAIMTYEMQPYLVVRGIAKTFNGDGSLKGFCDYIDNVCNTDPSAVLSKDWYVTSIAKRILFIRAKEVVRQFIKDNERYLPYKIFSSTAYVYALSLLNAILEEKGQSINLDKIWEYQDIDDCTSDNILRLCRFIFPIIAKDPAFVMTFKNKSKWDTIRQSALENKVLVSSIDTRSSFYCNRKPFLITRIPMYTAPMTPSQQKVWVTYPDYYWDELDTWLNRHTEINKPAALDKRLSHKKLTDKQCQLLLDLAEHCAKIYGPKLPRTPIIDLPRTGVKSCTGNPINAFLNGNDYDILVLDRSCDLKGGSIFIDELFQRFATLKAAEQARANEQKPELGETRVFDLTAQKKVVFLYSKLTSQSVPYLPVLEVCLSALAREFTHDNTILMTHVWYEGTAPQNALTRQRIVETATSELYMMKSVTLMSLPLEKQ